MRALTVSAIRLSESCKPCQTDFFGIEKATARRGALDTAVDALRQRFGENCLRAASLLGPNPIATDRCETVPMPQRMYRSK